MGHNYVAFMLAMCLWGAGLAGFVPMTPLVPMMAPDKKGAANSAVNFGSGTGISLGQRWSPFWQGSAPAW